MKVRIEDKEALQALSWKALRAYLDRDKGWKYAEDIPGQAAVYQHTGKGKRLREVVVPLRNDFADYAARMGDAVGTLARVEDRSELDVYEDLRALGAKIESGTQEDAEPSPPAIDEATRAVHERIRTWLAEEGWQVRDINDPQARFNVLVTLPNDSESVNIFQYRDHMDHITLSQHCVFDEQSRLEIAHLPLAVQRDAVLRIRRDASLLGVDLTGLTVPPSELTIRTTIYFDGLSKDALVQRIRLTIRALFFSLETFVLALNAAGDAGESSVPDRQTEQATNGEHGYSVEVTATDPTSELPANVVSFRSRGTRDDNGLRRAVG
jgi:hypothetical protein